MVAYSPVWASAKIFLKTGEVAPNMGYRSRRPSCEELNVNNFLILAQAETSTGMGATQYLFGGIYVLVCLAMILSILMKTPKNDGLGGMMGGGGDAASFKGAKSKDDQVDTITNWIAILFISMSIGLNFVF